MTTRALAAVALVATLAACSPVSQSLSTGDAANALPLAPRTTTPIAHVVFIVQENRSFNNLFMNFPQATTQRYGYDTSGEKIALHAVDLSTTYDIDHSSTAFFAACD